LSNELGFGKFATMPEIDLILSRDAYLLGVELSVCWGVAALYGASLLLYIMHLLSRQRALGAVASAVHWVAVAAGIAVFVLRSVETGRLPCHTTYEGLLLFALTVSLATLLLSRKYSGFYLQGLGAAAVSVGACMVSLLSHSPAPAPATPVFSGPLFDIHLALLYVSMGVLASGAIVELSSRFVSALLAAGPSPSYGLVKDTAAKLLERGASASALALPMLALSVVAGAAWSEYAFGRYWSWSATETWTLVVIAIFAMHLHTRSTERFNESTSALFNAAGAAVVISVLLAGAVVPDGPTASGVIMLSGLLP